MGDVLKNPKWVAGAIAIVGFFVYVFRGSGATTSNGQTLYTTGLSPQMASELAQSSIAAQTKRLTIRSKSRIAEIATRGKIATEQDRIDAGLDVARAKIEAGENLGLHKISASKTVAVDRAKRAANVANNRIRTRADVSRKLSADKLAALADTNKLRHFIAGRRAQVANEKNELDATIRAGETLNEGFSTFTDWFSLDGLLGF